MTQETEARPHRARRWVLRVLVFWIAGMIASVGVAWLIEAARAVRLWRATASVSHPSTVWAVADPLMPGSELSAIRVRTPWREEWIVDRPMQAAAGDADLLLTTEKRAIPPAWAPIPPLGDGVGTGSVGYGFPLVCMCFQSDRQSVTTGPGGFRTSISYRGSAWKLWFSGQDLYMTLPLRPVWLGLAVDGALYGALLASLLSVKSLMRWRRRKRGLCAWCGYDLKGGGGTCPECGRT